MQEATNNAIRHSRTAVIHFSALSEEHNSVFTVRDEGVGFTGSGMEAGDGLANMRYRAEQSGFMLGIQSEPGAGTTVALRL